MKKQSHIHKKADSSASNPVLSQLQSRPNISQAKPQSDKPLTQTQTENQEFHQQKSEATKLELQAKYGTITPEGQEQLTVLQAKMSGSLQRRLARASHFSRNFANIPISPNVSSASTAITQKRASEEQEVKEGKESMAPRDLAQPQGVVQRREMYNPGENKYYEVKNGESKEMDEKTREERKKLLRDIGKEIQQHKTIKQKKLDVGPHVAVTLKKGTMHIATNDHYVVNNGEKMATEEEVRLAAENVMNDYNTKAENNRESVKSPRNEALRWLGRKKLSKVEIQGPGIKAPKVNGVDRTQMSEHAEMRLAHKFAEKGIYKQTEERTKEKGVPEGMQKVMHLGGSQQWTCGDCDDALKLGRNGDWMKTATDANIKLELAPRRPKDKTEYFPNWISPLGEPGMDNKDMKERIEEYKKEQEGRQTYEGYPISSQIEKGTQESTNKTKAKEKPKAGPINFDNNPYHKPMPVRTLKDMWREDPSMKRGISDQPQQAESSTGQGLKEEEGKNKRAKVDQKTNKEEEKK